MVKGVVRCSRELGAPEWDLVIGSRFVVALEAPAPPSVVSSFATHVLDDAPALEPLVGRIPLGADGVESFALVWWPPGDGPVTVVVRGEAAVDLASPGGRRRFDARGIHPWHLAEFREVTAIRFGAAASPLDAIGEPAHHVVRGLGFVRATSMEWRAIDGTEAGAASAARSVSDSAELEPAVLLPSPDRSTWAEAEPESASPARAVAPLRFRIGAGEPVAIGGIVRIGRNPQPPNDAGATVELVSVPRSAAEVSATHLELRREGVRLIATDLRSTNGTLVRTPAGERRMRTGESIVVAPGAVLDLGSDTIGEILPPQDDHAISHRQGQA